MVGKSTRNAKPVIVIANKDEASREEAKAANQTEQNPHRLPTLQIIALALSPYKPSQSYCDRKPNSSRASTLYSIL